MFDIKPTAGTLMYANFDDPFKNWIKCMNYECKVNMRSTRRLQLRVSIQDENNIQENHLPRVCADVRSDFPKRSH